MKKQWYVQLEIHVCWWAVYLTRILLTLFLIYYVLIPLGQAFNFWLNYGVWQHATFGTEFGVIPDSDMVGWNQILTNIASTPIWWPNLLALLLAFYLHMYIFVKIGTLEEELKALKEKLGEQQSLAFSAGKIIGKVMSVFRVR